MIRPFGGFLEFAICRIDEILRFRRVTAELVLILSLSFVDLAKGLLKVMLGLREIRMPV